MSSSIKIVCPQCGFTQQLGEDRIPKGSVIATCPRCECRFRFSRENGAGQILPPKGWRTVPAKDASQPQPPQPSRDAPEEEEDIRLTASRAYQREAERFQQSQESANSENDEALLKQEYISRNPWDDAPGENGWYSAFSATVIRVMLAPQYFFANLNPQSQKFRALFFYLIICVFQTLVEKFWGYALYTMLSPDAAADPQMERLLSLLASDGNLALNVLLRCGFLVLQLYFLTFLMFMIYRVIRPERATYSLIFQIMAYSTAPSLLCAIPILGSIVGMLWGIGCLLVGCKSAMRLNWPQTLLGFLPIIMILAPLFPYIGSILRQ